VKAWKSNRFKQYEMRARPWKEWFAWYPVKSVSDKWHWGKTIYRKSGHDSWLDVGMGNWHFYADVFDILNEDELVKQFDKLLKR
jgi:hypothetical protein